MIKGYDGNVLTFPKGKKVAIMHQTNTQGAFGSGLARVIKRNFPTIESDYYKLCKETESSMLLGTVQALQYSEDVFFFNAFSQEKTSRTSRMTDYNAVKKVFKIALEKQKELGIDIVQIPYKYGSALGGGDWNIVLGIIEDVYKDVPEELHIIKLV